MNLALPGAGTGRTAADGAAATAPAFHAGFHYFEIDRAGELWKQVERGGSLAMHVAGDFPGLDLELWAMRQ